MESAKEPGAYVDTTNRITLAEKAREYAATRPHRASTAAHTKSLIDTHIAPTALGAMRLSAVRHSHVQAWVADRSRVLSPSTLRAVAGLLRSVFNAAVLDRLIASSPAVRLSLPRSERERVVPLTVEQVRHLSQSVPERCRANGDHSSWPWFAYR